MNVYIVTKFKDDYYCLFKVVEMIKGKHYTFIKIGKVIIDNSNGELIFEETIDGSYLKRRWADEEHWYEAFFISNKDLILIELPDDESAKLWFALEYGG